MVHHKKKSTLPCSVDLCDDVNDDYDDNNDDVYNYNALLKFLHRFSITLYGC